VEPAVLRMTLAIVLIGAGLALLIKAGLGIPVGVIVPFPLAVIALLIVTMVRSRRAKAEVGA
jgi:Flp pilus assembly protein TadB